MFLKRFRNGLPKCKVAHSIRQSYLYKEGKNIDVYSNCSKNYPLRYCYIHEGSTNSFYYSKNNLIEYYMHLMKNNGLVIVPVYNYVKNNYELILSPLEYDFMNHHTICLVRSPNGQVYMDSEATIVNVSRGISLYQLSDDVKYLIRSMPIANSFVLVVMNNHKEIIVHIIDLIKEKTYVKKYPIEKIIKHILMLSEKDDKNYKELADIRLFDKLHFSANIINSIDDNIDNLVFYDKCIINVSLSFKKTNTRDEKTLKDALSILAIYQKNELTVSLQINSSINLETPNFSYVIKLKSSMILTSDKYKIENKYDISKSHLYSVIVSAGDYTIINEPNVNRFVLYHKNEMSFISSNEYLDINNFGNILFVRASNKLFVFAKKDRLRKLHEVKRYYIEYEGPYINIIDTKIVSNLILHVIQRSSNISWVVMEITDMVKRVNLENKLKNAIRHYVCPNNNFLFFLYTHYIDHESEEFYFLVHFQCLERVEANEPVPGKYRIYLFKDRIDGLFSSHDSLRLVWKIETDDPPRNTSSILCTHATSGDKLNIYTMLSKLLNNKFINENEFFDEYEFINMKAFEIYKEIDAYYDDRYSRRSVTLPPVNTSFASTLHLVRRIKQILF